jgi:hypothetical protein
MDFKKLKEVIESPEHEETRKAAISGFSERQKARNEKFEREAKARQPSESWYNRRYDI